MGKRIILVEDEPDIREMLEMYFELKGYEIKLTCEGHEALKAVKESLESNNPYDVLITDINMPQGMGGLELMHNLIKNPVYKDFKSPIIALSGHLDNEKKAKALSSDISFLEKPVQPLEKLIALVESLTSIPQQKGA